MCITFDDIKYGVIRHKTAAIVYGILLGYYVIAYSALFLPEGLVGAWIINVLAILGIILTFAYRQMILEVGHPFTKTFWKKFQF